jgi:hypothetical protein
MPFSSIQNPIEGAIVSAGKGVTISGSATNGLGGRLTGRVDVSVDGGTTYSEASLSFGLSWSFNWVPSATGPVTIKSRAVDNSGNMQNPPAEIHVTAKDLTPPTSKITSPTAGASVLTGTEVNITGTASDVGGTVARVHVSVDGGSTYSTATGTTAWSFKWTPTTPGKVTIKSRAVDDSENQQDPPAEITVTVPIRVPSDQPTIQSAIDVATDGNTVLVEPGTYSEHIDFKGKAITVTSEGGSDVTTIDAGNTDPVVSFTSQEGRDSVLNGFTLKNGRTNFSGQGAPPNGGGIVIQRASPKITNNVITNNHASMGSGIGINFGSPLIQLNKITGNINDVTIGGGGGGILISGEGSAEILDNEISDNVNAAGGGIFIPGGGATPIIKRNVIKGNSVPLGAFGGGIYTVNNSSPLIVQNLIIGNQASNGGGVFWAVSNGVRGPILVNNTIADNDGATNGSGIFADGADDQVEVTNNIIVAKPGQTALHCGPADGHIDPIIRFNNIFSSGGMAYGGSCADVPDMNNISADPMFTNPTQGDYHLQQGSLSIDAGDNLAPNLPDKDLDGNPRILDGDGDGTAIIDMGVYEFLAPPSFNISLQLDRRIRMRRESDARFSEGAGVRFPRATRLLVGGITAGYQFTGKASK